MSLSAGSDNKAQVLQATDIVELIGQSVALKRRGSSFVGLCPFHQEKTPSFHVHPSKQYFHCFGCKATGNAIDFVIKRDRIEFIDALRMLAEKAGIELARFSGEKQKAGERQMLFDAQSAACAFFENWLNHPAAGQAARDYLAGRGFTPETIKQFRIGLAADSWDALLRWPGMKKFPPGLLAAAGLVKPRQQGGGFYDTFRNRIMFPILEEAQARIIAFGGRKMPNGEDPKYLNSPETPLFSKSKSIYGLNFARQKMIETGTAVVVEGYTDVVMAHQYGASNVVAILGTAMTEQHVNLLRRFAKKIVLLYDADEAGNTAVDRSVELFLTKDVEIAIASMPEGVDPDEYVMQHGAAGFEKLVAEAKDVLSYIWAGMARRFSDAKDDLSGQQKAVESYLALLGSARESGPVDQMRWGAVLARVSRLMNIPIDELHRRFRKKKATRRVAASVRDTAQHSPQNALAAEVASPVSAPVNESVPKIPHAQELAERQMLGILLKEPERWHQIGQVVHPEDFGDLGHKRLAEVYWQHQQHVGEPVFNEFLGLLSAESDKSLAAGLMDLAMELSSVEESLEGAIRYFAEQKARRENEKNKAEVMRTSQDGADPEVQKLTFEEFLKNNQALDLRRLGPVRRFKSGS
jgi:DNA primase